MKGDVQALYRHVTAPAPPAASPRPARNDGPAPGANHPLLLSPLPAPSFLEGSPLKDPGFELSDNIGRTSEQISTHRTGSATRADLYRWAHRDSAFFRELHPLTGALPAPDLTPYRQALNAAGSPAEFSYVLDTLLEALAPAVHEIVDHLTEHFYRWKKHNGGGDLDSPARLVRDAASRMLSTLALATEADVRALRAHYDPPPSPSPDTPSPKPPTPPPAPPAPGTAGPHR